MAKSTKIPEFLVFLHEAVQEQSFVKLQLGGYQGREEGLKQIHARRIIVKRQEVLSFTYRYQTRDIVKNYPFDEAENLIEKWLARDFMTATLFSSEHDLSFDAVKNTLKKSAATTKEAPNLSHDRAKTRQVDAGGGWLYLLGITDKDGKVRKDAQDKYRQIDKYIETLSAQLKNIDTPKGVRVADMGAGKGYLTFALTGAEDLNGLLGDKLIQGDPFTLQTLGNGKGNRRAAGTDRFHHRVSRQLRLFSRLGAGQAPEIHFETQLIRHLTDSSCIELPGMCIDAQVRANICKIRLKRLDDALK